jgi:hypothetical protein
LVEIKEDFSIFLENVVRADMDHESEDNAKENTGKASNNR